MSMSMSMAKADTASHRHRTNPEILWGTNATHIEIEMSFPTLGWIAIGLSPTGGMDRSDVLFGYVADDTQEVVIQDRYILADRQQKMVNLTLDAQQDWTTISGFQNLTHTVLRAIRRLTTCDPFDRPFVSGFLKVIFASNTHDPAPNTELIRKHTERSSTTINFLQSGLSWMPNETVIQALNFTIGHVHVDVDSPVAFYCRLLKMPKLTQPLHAIWARNNEIAKITEAPILDPDNVDMVHHIKVFSCGSVTRSVVVNEAFPCDSKMSTESVNYVMITCQTAIARWAIGRQTYYLPPEAGLPFTPDMSENYFLVMVHYNYPISRSFIDNSGMSFGLTDQLRKYETDVLETGVYNFDNILTIPPGVASFRVSAQCSDQCTSKIPPEGITIFTAFVHMHARGREGVARHFRGSQELPPLLTDRNYDFSYQTATELSPPRTFLPGDRIVVDCTYSTTNNEHVIFGGPGSQEEMCTGYFDYYPKTDIRLCAASYNMAGYVAAVGLPPKRLLSAEMTRNPDQSILETIGHLRPTEQALLREDLQRFVEGTSWTEPAVAHLEDFYRSKQYTAVCDQGGEYFYIRNDSPPFVEPLEDLTSYIC